MFPVDAVDEDEELDRDTLKRVLWRTARELRPYRRTMIIALALMITYTLTILGGPYLVKFGIDEGIKKDNATNLNIAVGVYLVVVTIGFFVHRFQVLYISRVGEGFLRDLRIGVFDHLQRLSMPFYDREKAGVVVSRMTSDIDIVQQLIQGGIVQFVSAALLVVVTAVVLAVVSWQLALICLIPVPVVVAASVKFQRDSNRAYLSVRDRIAMVLSSLQEGISGVRVIQASTREETEIRRFGDANRTLYEAHMRSVRIQAWYLPVIELAGLGTTALVVGLGGWMTLNEIVGLGTITFFVLSLSNLFEPIQQLSQLFNQVQSSGAALNKVFDLLDTEIDLPEDDDAVDLPASGVVSVSAVSFAYKPGEPVLSDVSLDIAEGERLALVGPTGAGKSTLAKLVARMYDPTEGAITFGGTDLRRATLASLRQRVVVVPQEGFLFNGTIADNVRLGRHDATDAEVAEALDRIGVLDRFRALPDGLATEVNERGSRLSAGEKQLVSLARAALADPALLVLDEATSSLDPGTESLVETALERLMGGRTVVVIAHRLSTSERADRVGVVVGGRLAELGPHAELAHAGGPYSELYATWTEGLTPA